MDANERDAFRFCAALAGMVIGAVILFGVTAVSIIHNLNK